MIWNGRSTPNFPINTIEKAAPFEPLLAHPGGLCGLKMMSIMDFLTKLSVNRQPTYHASFGFNFGSWSTVHTPWGLPWHLAWVQKSKLTSKTAFLTKIPVNRHPTCNISFDLNFGPLPHSYYLAFSRNFWLILGGFGEHLISRWKLFYMVPNIHIEGLQFKNFKFFTQKNSGWGLK